MAHPINRGSQPPRALHQRCPLPCIREIPLMVGDGRRAGVGAASHSAPLPAHLGRCRPPTPHPRRTPRQAIAPPTPRTNARTPNATPQDPPPPPPRPPHRGPPPTPAHPPPPPPTTPSAGAPTPPPPTPPASTPPVASPARPGAASRAASAISTPFQAAAVPPSSTNSPTTAAGGQNRASGIASPQAK